MCPAVAATIPPLTVSGKPSHAALEQACPPRWDLPSGSQCCLPTSPSRPVRLVVSWALARGLAWSSRTESRAWEAARESAVGLGGGWEGDRELSPQEDSAEVTGRAGEERQARSFRAVTAE